MGEEDNDIEYQIWLDNIASNSDNGNADINIGDINISVDSIYDSAHNGYTITVPALDTSWDSWKDWSYSDQNTHNNITLTGGGEEMLRVAEDGFYVRGVKVPAGKREAQQVYKAFKEWLTWANLSKHNDE